MFAERARILLGACMLSLTHNSHTRPSFAALSMRLVAMMDHAAARPANHASGPSGAPGAEWRWLARECGLPAAPTPHLASMLLADDMRGAAAIAHIAWWSRHANPTGTFARATRDLPDGPDAERVAALFARGYGGLLYLADGEIVGNYFFQRHDDAMHAFSGWSHERLRSTGLIANATMDFIACTRATDGMRRARVGADNVSLQQRLLAPLVPVAARLGWRLRDGGWIDF